jgi:hypothetical protein
MVEPLIKLGTNHTATLQKEKLVQNTKFSASHSRSESAEYAAL